MALALRLDELVRTGQVASYSQLASLGQVTRSRISQIVSLLHLAPDIQEALLFLPPTLRGRDAIILADLMPIAASWTGASKGGAGSVCGPGPPRRSEHRPRTAHGCPRWRPSRPSRASRTPCCTTPAARHAQPRGLGATH